MNPAEPGSIKKDRPKLEATGVARQECPQSIAAYGDYLPLKVNSFSPDFWAASVYLVDPRPFMFLSNPDTGVTADELYCEPSPHGLQITPDSANFGAF